MQGANARRAVVDETTTARNELVESNLIVQAMYSDTADSPRDDVSDDGQQTMTERDMESDLIAALNQIFGSDEHTTTFEQLLRTLKTSWPRAAAAGREAIEEGLDRMDAANFIHIGGDGYIHLV